MAKQIKEVVIEDAKPNYEYYVCYGSNAGIQGCTLKTPDAIKCGKDVVDLAYTIGKQNNLKSVTIINFILLNSTKKD